MNLKLRLLSRLRFRQIMVKYKNFFINAIILHILELTSCILQINGNVFKDDLEVVEKMIKEKIQDAIIYGKAAKLMDMKKEVFME